MASQLTHLLTRSLTHPPTHPPTQLPTHSSTHSPTCLLAHPLTCPPMQPPTYILLVVLGTVTVVSVVMHMVIMVFIRAIVQATKDTRYLDAGAAIIKALYHLNWVEGGWASMHSVLSTQLEDHMPSYFLAEACKYLFLLFDDSFLQVPCHLRPPDLVLLLPTPHEPPPCAPLCSCPEHHMQPYLAFCKGRLKQKTCCCFLKRRERFTWASLELIAHCILYGVIMLSVVTICDNICTGHLHASCHVMWVIMLTTRPSQQPAVWWQVVRITCSVLPCPALPCPALPCPALQPAMTSV